MPGWIETDAEVERVSGHHAWVRIRPHTPCGHCDPATGCKAVALSRLFGQTQRGFRVKNDLVAQPGDQVRVGIGDRALLSAALTGYGVPLVALLAGATLGGMLVPAAWREFGAVAGGGLGLLGAFGWLKRRAPHNAEPRILAVYPDSDSPGARPDARVSNCSRSTLHQKP
ncbi:SoxR reducing system RseC family protein [Chitiniphilus eburneus]|uniref:Fis family transcriptional regulator n=1 Tax=Chitiniphilus eburneus TaxID=2571148 RepID=A0A4U0PIR0_9NEIS|nr:SoxR reducing system RseC family protein [Chitiniphilus eburneus]TJZ67779.1 Fis family transcriptional regulator [Chitiniphilus eburneus]